jgi:hypothetical protein
VKNYLKRVTGGLQMSKEVRTGRTEQRVMGDSHANEVRVRLQDNSVKKTDTADRQNTTEEGITGKNSGAGIRGREDNVFSLCGGTNNYSSVR